MAEPHGRSHLLRAGRVSLHRQVYLVTTCTRGRRPLLDSPAPARAVIAEMRRLDQAGIALTVAFVLMPDHVHWLLQLEAGRLAQTLRLFKGRSAHAVNRCLARTGRLWQPGFHDHALRRDESLPAVVRYLVGNPVRAGLVANPEDWPYWYSAVGLPE